jgi:hypothetical protein
MKMIEDVSRKAPRVLWWLSKQSEIRCFSSIVEDMCDEAAMHAAH